MKKLLTLSSLIMIAAMAFSQTARVQVIHNSADAAAEEVDVYLDNTLLLDDFAFRTATPFIDAPAGSQIVLGIAPANSMSVADTIVGFPVTLTAGETYVVVADGIVSMSGYNPATPFNLEIYAMGREAASTSGNTDVLVHHGSTDAPTVDVVETSVPAGTIVDDLAYGEFQGYLELGTADYILDVTDMSGANTVVSYSAPLSTLGLEDSALVVVASGFLDSTMNNNGPSFGLYVALPGGGNMIALPLNTATGIESAEAYGEMSLFPNPTDGIVTFSIDEVENDMRYQVVNLQGQVVKASNLIQGNNTIDLSDLPTGMYQFTVFNTNSIITNRKVSLVR